jgi:hypothetical protein
LGSECPIDAHMRPVLRQFGIKSCVFHEKRRKTQDNRCGASMKVYKIS